MVRRPLFLWVICTLVVAFQVVEANAVDIFESGTTFYDACSLAESLPDNPTRTDSLNAGMCIGFVAGIDLGISMAEQSLGVKEGQGANSSRIQEIRIIRKYINDHPAKAHLSAAALSFVALREAFPCK